MTQVPHAKPDTVIHSATMVNEGTATPDAWVAITDGVISTVGTGQSWPCDAATVIDAAGKLLIPGVIDTHVHFRDPGLTRKADFASESLAAAAGGVTSVIDMPNTKPATVNIDTWTAKMEMGRVKSAVNYAFFLGATNDNLQELLRADYTRVPGIKLFLGSSTGNMLVDSRRTLEQLFEAAPAIIAIHAESEALVKQGRDSVAARYADGSPVPISCHPEIRSRKACYEASHLAVEMSRRYNTRIHLLHISTADELGLLGDPTVTSETCPHYLWFDSSDYDRLGTRIKCNPAIKDASDREQLMKAVADGRIDTIATDHAPHLPADKEGDALHAASGMPGIDSSLRVMLELCEKGMLTVERMVDAMCHRPAEIFSIDRRGFIRPGYAADLVLVEHNDNPEPLTDADALTHCGWTPYISERFHWHPVLTLVNGHTVYSADAGPRYIENAAQPITFCRQAPPSK